MKRRELNKHYRDLLLANPSLRRSIAVDLFITDRTVENQARANSPKLTAPHFLKSLKKHGNISEDTSEMTELVEMEVHPEA